MQGGPRLVAHRLRWGPRVDTRAKRHTMDRCEPCATRWIDANRVPQKGMDGAADPVTLRPTVRLGSFWSAVRTGGAFAPERRKRPLKILSCMAANALYAFSSRPSLGTTVSRFLQCGFRCNVLPPGLEVHCICSYGRPCGAGPTTRCPSLSLVRGGREGPLPPSLPPAGVSEGIWSSRQVESSSWGTLHI